MSCVFVGLKRSLGMKFFNKVKNLYKTEQSVFGKPKKGSKKLVFDMGVIPTIASLLLLFSTVGASIFFTKNNISKTFSTETAFDTAGQISISNELISSTSDTSFLGSVTTFSVVYSNSGTTVIDSLPLQYIIPSSHVKFSSIDFHKTIENVTFNPSKDNYLEEEDDEKNYGSAEKLSIIGKDSKDAYSLMQFDVSGHTGKTVESAELNIYITGGEGKGNDIAAHLLNRDWEEGLEDGDLDKSNWLEATSTGSWTTPGGDYNASPMASLSTANQGYTSTNLPTSDIQNWVDNSANNYGMILRSSGSSDKKIEITSREYPSSDLPYLKMSLSTVSGYVVVGDTIFIENLGSLAIGESDSFEILLRSLDTTSFGVTEAQVINATEVGGGVIPAEVSVTAFTISFGPEICGDDIDNDGDNLIDCLDVDDCGPTILSSITDPSCWGSNNGKIKITAFGGSSGYTYLWSTGSTIDKIENLSAGTYSVTVSDANSCLDSFEIIVGTPAELILTIDSTSNYNGFEISCYGENDGAIYTTPKGGTTPYSFAWSVGAGTSDDTLNLSIGTYEVTVTDANGCTATAAITLSESAELGLNVAYISSTDFTGYGVSCYGESDGQIWVSAFGGDGTHSYAWSNGVSGISGIQNLAPNTYTVTVTDGSGCTATSSYLMTEPPLLELDTVSISSQKFNGYGVSCNGASDGQIKVVGTGGDSAINYAYSWSTGVSGVDEISGLAPGVYTVTLVDGNSCNTSMTFTITEPDLLLINSTITNVNCNGSTNGEIELLVSGGTSNYTYAWSTGATTLDISSLAAGDYTITVSDKNSCQLSETYTIVEPDTFSVSAVISDIKCFEGNDGAIAQTVNGGTPPYFYKWNNGATVEDIFGLTAGIYTVSITDFYNCPIEVKSYTVGEPNDLTISETHSDVTCYGGIDGNISITPTGGTPIYTYLWSNGATTTNLNSIVAGTYTLTVTDANNCQESITVMVGKATEITATATIDSVLCNGQGNGSISLSVSGGNPGYSYIWNNLATTSNINNLSAGTYTVTITDNSSCTIINSYTVFEPVILNTTISKTDPLCFGETTGELTANSTGGTTAYSYKWSNGATTKTISNLGATTYTVTVTDKNNCSTTLSEVISTPAEMSATDSSIDPLCNGDNNGSIVIIPSGGVSPYTYQWNVAGTSNTLNNLTAGNYTVTITDLQNCDLVYNTTLAEPTILNLSSTSTDILCFGDSTGTIDMTITGGTSKYIYDWDDMVNEGMWTFEEVMDDVSGNNNDPISFSGNETYSTDAVGGQYSFEFDGSSKIRYSADFVGFLETSFQNMTISMWVKPDALTDINTLFERGTSARGFALRMDGSDVQGVVTLGSSPQLTSKVPFPSDGAWHHLALVYNDGDLILYLDGVAGSTINTPYNTISASTGNGGIGGTQGSDAFGNTGNRYYEGLMDNAFFHDNALTAFQVQDLADNNGDRTNLSQGTYNIEITDGNGCKETASITINEPTELILTTNETNISCNGGNDGVARVVASGATGSYTYSWGGAEIRDSLTGLSVGDYTVTVTDNNGCSNTATVTIVEPSVLAASASGQDANCNGGSDGQISLTVNGGIPTYTYVWSGGGGVSQNPTGLSANTYTVTITDSNGCTVTASTIVDEPSVLSTINSVIDISCIGETDGSITATATGGTTNYSYSWNNGETTPTISNLVVGTYIVTVTDAFGCTSTASSNISEPSIMVISSSITNVSCSGGDDGGVINLTVTGGTPGYTYLWSDMDVEAYYGFEQSMNDETGNNHNPLGGEGIEAYALDNIERDYAFDFNGGTKIEYEKNNTFLNGTISTFSVSMWVKPDNFSGTQILFDMGGVSAGFGIRLSGNFLQVGANEFYTLYGLQYPFPNDGAWHHITITFDNSDLVFFFDGSELGTYSTGIGSVNISNSQEGGLGGTFGTDAFGGAGNFFYDGLMDGVGYYNNALTAQQVAEVMLNDGTRDLLSADSYIVTVIDANGCLSTQTLSVVEPPALTISNSKEDIGCNGELNGEIDITVGGGTPNYTFAWSNSATTQDLTGLAPGDYTVTVSDVNGCTILLTETISEPTSLSISTQRIINYNGSDVSCAGNNDGAVEVIISGGTPNYNISWSSGQTTQQINSLGAGTYIVTVTDDSGCSGTSQISLSAPPSINLSVDRTVDYTNEDISCNGASDGSLGTTVSGGSGTYTYSWSNGETSSGVTNLLAGTYTVTVTDGFGCTVTASDIVSEPSELATIISLNGTFGSSGVSCAGASDGNIISASSGGTTGYTYLWNGGQTTADLNNIGAGVYMLTITDANNCTAADTITISAPSDLSFTTNYSDLTDCGVDDGAIGINASGGTGSYEYSKDGSTWQTSNEFNNLAPGTYNAYVRNDVGTCVQGPKTVVINVPEAPIVNNTVLINPSSDLSADGSIIVNASGNGVQLNYQLDGVTGWQTSSVFSNLTEGVYTIKVKYYNQSCETSTIVELVAGGGVVGGSQNTDYCSGDINSGQLVEIYYIPFPENQVLESLYSFNDDDCGWNEKVRNPVQSYVSIGVVEEGTIIYYDHWEDGYEPNLGFPIQSSTEVWGDGDLTNGFAPGHGSNDLFLSSDNIILSESIDTTTAVRIATIDYDGSDKIASRGNIAMTRLAWADGSETLLAGAIEVYPVPYWGTDYEIPVGEDYLVNEMFEYTGFVVMATENNTTVNIDADASGTTETTVVLNEGESYLANGNVNSGGTIQASANVQVHLVTGDDCAGFRTRWFTLKPTEQWSNAYYTAVSTLDDDTYVQIYNPSVSTITIDWETNSGSETAFTVGAGNTESVSIPDGSGAKFSSSGGEVFYAISTTGVFTTTAHDWGYALIPEDQLSPQITLVSLAPGIDPTASCNTNTIISQSGWSLNYVDSEETVDELAPATNAFDGNTSTYWHTEYGASNPAHPHEIQIDLGATHNVSGFRYLPRSGGSGNLTIESTDVGKYLPDDTKITSTLSFPNSWTIADVNLINLDITHTDIEDLVIKLKSPDGTNVKLFNRDCSDGDEDMFLDFDDEGSSSFPCPPSGGNAYQSLDQSLSNFDGEDASGTWTLEIESKSSSDDGTLNGWSLEITSSSGGVGDGAIEDYEFYISGDGTNWGSAVATGTFPNSSSEQEITFIPTGGRYIRLVSSLELNGNPWTSVAELNVLECTNSENSAPVWITAAYPSGSTSTGNINVCVDFNGDGGSQTDANGISYDSTFIFSHLDREKILDADGDQTGMRIWVCDGSDAIIAGAWGQDPSTASGGSPAIDLGVGLPNGIPFSTSKCVNLSKDYNLDGNFDECDEVIYTIIVENTGVLPISVGSLNIVDTLPDGITYLENTTISRINGVNDTIQDETLTASVFPLDENGISYNSVIQPGDSIILFFQASIDDLTGNGTTITNQAFVSNFQTQFVPEVTFPVDNPENPFLTGVPSDLTVECDSIPIAPLMNEPNCTFSNIDYSAAQTAGTTAMDAQAISGDGVTATFNLLEGGIAEEFRIADNLYPRDGLQNIPCGASTKAIDFQIQQVESNGRYGSDSTCLLYTSDAADE